MLFLRNNGLIEVLTGIDFKKPPVPVIGNSSTICDLSNQVANGIPRRGPLDSRLLSSNRTLGLLDLFSMFDVDLKNFISSIPVCIVVVIDDIPSKSFETLSLNDEGVVPA